MMALLAPLDPTGEQSDNGTVPVEEDGSAFFRAPARVPLQFQALDARGQAVQTMRSVTYLRAGERRSCVGCHETPNQTQRPTLSLPLAMQRRPSAPAPQPGENAVNREIGAKIEEALSGLGEDQRMAFVLREYEGLDYDTIAQVLGVSVSMARKIEQGALRKLRGQMEEIAARHGTPIRIEEKNYVANRQADALAPPLAPAGPAAHGRRRLVAGSSGIAACPADHRDCGKNYCAGT